MPTFAPDGEAHKMQEELKKILWLDAPENFVYSPGLFDMRLKEELLRSHRQELPFIYLQLPLADFNRLGMERPNSDRLRAWKIAVLSLFTFVSPMDIKGYLDGDSGIGVIMIGKTDRDIIAIKEKIEENLRAAGLIKYLNIHPDRPFFRAMICPAQIEKERLQTEERIEQLNREMRGYFLVEEYRYSQLWNNPWNRWFMDWIKRGIDFVGALVALLLLFPFFLFAAIAIKLTSPGPLFFGQTRVGKDGDLFTMWKFRSMYVDAEARKEELIAAGQNLEKEGPTFKMKSDPRITPIGRVLRKYSVDELPQLWNVLVGDMALVGPRPPVPQEVLEYLPWHKMRLAVKPGLTCHWQVGGRSNIGFEEWMRLDNHYIRHGTLKTDMALLGKTFKAVVKGDGAY